MSVVIAQKVVRKALPGHIRNKSFEDRNPCIISARARQAEGTATSKPGGQGCAWLVGRTPKKAGWLGTVRGGVVEEEERRGVSHRALLDSKGLWLLR